MSTIRIFRQRIVSYEIQEYCDLTPDEYREIVMNIVNNKLEPSSENIAEQCDELGYDWEIEYSEGIDPDKTTDTWVEDLT